MLLVALFVVFATVSVVEAGQPDLDDALEFLENMDRFYSQKARPR